MINLNPSATFSSVSSSSIDFLSLFHLCVYVHVCDCVCKNERLFVNNERVALRTIIFITTASSKCAQNAFVTCVCFCASRTMHHYLSPANWTSAPEIILPRRPSIQPSVRAPASAILRPSPFFPRILIISVSSSP